MCEFRYIILIPSRCVKMRRKKTIFYMICFIRLQTYRTMGYIVSHLTSLLGRSLNAVWTYETPFEAMAQIKDYVAFYPDRADEIS